MKYCFPVMEELGLDSPVCPHFGSAPGFLVVDDTDMSTEVVKFTGERVHGGCAPVVQLAGHGFDAMVVGGIGVGALNKFMNLGAKVYRAQVETVRGNLELLKQGGLEECGLDDTCRNGHGHGGGGHGGGCQG